MKEANTGLSYGGWIVRSSLLKFAIDYDIFSLLGRMFLDLDEMLMMTPYDCC
ncbi:MAG: hypothetical protein DF168_01046 [Candidatus Moanabacter tarae]|uniref:Uncharacterized protein n=1 Tax=Candidatus Moanibacter tarae TaxID=2200854 RepID=A0A2Z4ALK7_9BACT|nr:MAG: hypothetical protein DF168_01046 [Candidatus Moanabacter tarae]